MNLGVIYTMNNIITDAQFYFLIGGYIYLNFFLSINVMKRDLKRNTQLMTLFFIWLIPFCGYFIVTIILIINDVKFKKIDTLLKFIVVCMIYGIFFLMLGKY